MGGGGGGGVSYVEFTNCYNFVPTFGVFHYKKIYIYIYI